MATSCNSIEDKCARVQLKLFILLLTTSNIFFFSFFVLIFVSSDKNHHSKKVLWDVEGMFKRTQHISLLGRVVSIPGAEYSYDEKDHAA